MTLRLKIFLDIPEWDTIRDGFVSSGLIEFNSTERTLDDLKLEMATELDVSFCVNQAFNNHNWLQVYYADSVSDAFQRTFFSVNSVASLRDNDILVLQVRHPDGVIHDGSDMPAGGPIEEIWRWNI